MKKIYSLGLSAVAVVLACQMPMQAYATEIAPGVQDVYPAPDRRVNVGPNDYYLGLQEIAFQYGEALEVNLDCSGVACIYRQGDSTPIQTVGVEGASVDVMINSRCSVLFPYACNANGSYTVTIPEGFWYVGEGEARTLSGAMTLDYEIYVPQAVWPAPGTLSELGTITVTFPDYDEARLLDKSKISLYGVGTVSDVEFEVVPGLMPNELDIKPASPITSAGDYKLQLLAGAMEGVKTGQDAAEPNCEMIYSWTVAPQDQPAVWPEEGELDEFTSFVLTLPEGAAFWFCDDRSKNYIYAVDASGNLSAEPLCQLKPVADMAAGTITLRILEGTKVIDSLTPAGGRYCMVLAKGLYSGSWGNDFINSPEYRYYYDIVTDPIQIADGVVGVYPTPGGRVNVGPNDFYLGVQEIAFQFDRVLTVNPDCTGTAYIYREGDPTPIQRVGVEGVNVDVMIPTRGSVLFPYPCASNGNYKVVIPEGFWYLGAEGEEITLSGAMTLPYEIYVPQAVAPAPGVLESLSVITVSFPDFEKAELLDKSKISLYGVGTVADLEFDVTAGEYDNQLDIVIAAPVSKAGDYKLQLLAGAMRGVNADGSAESNCEMIYSWTIAAAAQPAITPAEGEVKEFSSFVISVPEGAAFWFCDDRSKNYIYEADEEGNLYSDPLCMVKPVADMAAGTITLTVMETSEGKDTLIPTDGYYCLVLAKGLYSGSWGDDFINSPELRYYYKVANNYSIVDTLDGMDAESADVYNMHGVRVLRGVTADDLRTLPAGIYVYAGRKVVVR